MEMFVTYWVGISLAALFSDDENAGSTMSEKSEKCLKKRKYDPKYKSEWASEFAGVVKGSEETRAKCTFYITEFSIVHRAVTEASMILKDIATRLHTSRQCKTQ